MVSARVLPWHGLGTVTPDAMKALEALQLGGLDWDVALHPLSVSIADELIPVPDRFAVVRDKDSSVLGTVGQRYVPFQNREAFTFMDNLVDSGDAIYETAGSLRGGRVVFITAKIPTDLKVADGDAHDLYLVLRTSHDGSKAVSVSVTPIRVVCMNTLRIALASAKYNWSAPHVSTIGGKVAEARDTLKLSYSYADAFTEFANQLAMTKVTDDAFDRLLQDVLPQRPRTEEVIDSMMDLFRSSPTNGYHGTAWGALNAVTEYLDHGRETRSQEAIMMNTLDGEVARIRNAASARLVALV